MRGMSTLVWERMSFAWKSCENYTRIEWWPAFEPKPDSELAADVGEHLMYPRTYLAKKEVERSFQRGRNTTRSGVELPRGPIQLEASTESPIVAGICT